MKKLLNYFLLFSLVFAINYCFAQQQNIEKQFHSNGKLKFSIQKIQDSINPNDWKRIGDYKEYFENGKIKITGFYVNGNKNGKWFTYDEKGELVNLETFDHGKNLEIGFEKFYHPVTKKIFLVNKYFGVGKFSTRSFNENGVLVSFIEYDKTDKKDYDIKISNYYKNSKIKSIEFYNDIGDDETEETGIWVYFDENGRQTKTTNKN